MHLFSGHLCISAFRASSVQLLSGHLCISAFGSSSVQLLSGHPLCMCISCFSRLVCAIFCKLDILFFSSSYIADDFLVFVIHGYALSYGSLGTADDSIVFVPPEYALFLAV